MKNAPANTIGATIELLVKSSREQKLSMPIFDPKDFILCKTEADKTYEGIYLGRYQEWIKFYGLKEHLKGNGYMLLNDTGVLFCVPDWNSLDFKMNQVSPTDYVQISVIEISETQKGEKFVRTAVTARATGLI